MTTAEKLKRCAGCRDDYYNHQGHSDTGYCWMIGQMKLEWRKAVHVDQRPPWTQKAERVPNCYKKPGYVYVAPNQTC